MNSLEINELINFCAISRLNVHKSCPAGLYVDRQIHRLNRSVHFVQLFSYCLVSMKQTRQELINFCAISLLIFARAQQSDFYHLLSYHCSSSVTVNYSCVEFRVSFANYESITAQTQSYEEKIVTCDRHFEKNT